MSEDTAKIRELLDRFERGWRKANAADLIGLWDPTCSDSIYIAAERDEPVYGFAGVKQYYTDAVAMFPITSMKIDNVHIHEYGSVAFAYCEIAIGFKVEENEHLVHPRATFVLRKREGQWYCIEYHESIKWDLPQS
jgi:uncharacterized protein (TIGR02246 family)